MKSKTIDVRWVSGRNEDVDLNVLKDLLCLEIMNFGTHHVEVHTDKAIFGISGLPSNHWSRAFEIPWALKMLDLNQTEAVLEVGGAGATLQFLAASRCRRFTNVDLCEKYIRDAEASPLHLLTGRKVTFHVMDFREFATTFTWETYDKIVSVSAIEHDDDPLGLLQAMWAKLKKRGRLVLTMDVADHLGPDHWIDHARMLDIARAFDFVVPEGSVVQASCPEADGNGTVQLRALCVCLEKVE